MRERSVAAAIVLFALVSCSREPEKAVSEPAHVIADRRAAFDTIFGMHPSQVVKTVGRPAAVEPAPGGARWYFNVPVIKLEDEMNGAVVFFQDGFVTEVDYMPLGRMSNAVEVAKVLERKGRIE